MHSLAPYTIRVFNPNLPGKTEDKYSILEKVGANDTFEILKDFIEEKGSGFHILEETKQVYRFDGIVINEEERKIYGWFKVGSYGVKNDIINVHTGNIDYEKTQENAEIINHFVYFKMPLGYNEGISLLHIFRGHGIKTVFFDLFRDFFRMRTNLNVQMNPLSYDKALSEWKEASAKEIRLVRFSGVSDISDKVKKLGHDEQILIFKPPRRSGLGKLKDYLSPSSDQAQAIEFLSEMCSEIKTVVELDGKKRTFSIGKNASNTICEVEAPEDLELKEGNPTFKGIFTWCESVADEFSQTLYR